jgi:isopentenyl diphosphate isomerase/L-lactate dehydrogenase-like FMN-dependent dehydrogenase
VLQLIDAEMRVAMALTGCCKIEDIGGCILDPSGDQATF